MLDWSQCLAVERVPGKLDGAWVFKGTRVPVRALFENLEDGARVDDFLEWFPGVTREQVEAVLVHAERSLLEAWKRPNRLRENMRILFDQGTPVPLRHALVDHHVSTAYEMGWAKLENGELLELAEANFDIFITTDQNLRYQRNLIKSKIAILVLLTTSWPRLQRHLSEVIAAVNTLGSGDFRELLLPS
jgi:uncharacterized protein (DUF433 family)